MSDASYSILVAEDESAFRHVITFSLEKAGFTVMAAANGRIAYELFSEHHFDLIVTDHQMPEMTGKQLCQRIREEQRNSDVPVIMLTAKAFPADEQTMCSEVGVTSIMTKPFSPNGLVRVVRQCLEASQSQIGS